MHPLNKQTGGATSVLQFGHPANSSMFRPMRLGAKSKNKSKNRKNKKLTTMAPAPAGDSADSVLSRSPSPDMMSQQLVGCARTLCAY
jgi:hypothetical protein